jgi:hypothetical protein
MRPWRIGKNKFHECALLGSVPADELKRRGKEVNSTNFTNFSMSDCWPKTSTESFGSMSNRFLTLDLPCPPPPPSAARTHPRGPHPLPLKKYILPVKKASLVKNDLGWALSSARLSESEREREREHRLPAWLRIQRVRARDRPFLQEKSSFQQFSAASLAPAMRNCPLSNFQRRHS